MHDLTKSTQKLGAVIFAVEDVESPVTRNLMGGGRCGVGGGGRCGKCGQGRCGPIA